MFKIVYGPEDEGGVLVQTPKKPPRKPRPGEIVAKKARAAAKKKKAAKRKPVKRKVAARKPAVRTERLDMRVTKADKAKLERRARKLQRSVTWVVLDAIGRMKG